MGGTLLSLQGATPVANKSSLVLPFLQIRHLSAERTSARETVRQTNRLTKPAVECNFAPPPRMAH